MLTSKSEREMLPAIKSFSSLKVRDRDNVLLATAKCSLNRLSHDSSEFQGKVVEDDLIY